MPEANGINWRRIGSVIGLLQLMILRMCGVRRMDIGASRMPFSTSLMKSSFDSVSPSGCFEPRACPMAFGRTESKKRISLSFRSMVLAI